MTNIMMQEKTLFFKNKKTKEEQNPKTKAIIKFYQSLACTIKDAVSGLS